MNATPDLGAATGDAMAVLRLLADGKAEHPTDITSEIGSINHRYARELLGLLHTQGLAASEERNGADVWIATEAGEALARQTAAWLNGPRTETTGHSPKEHQMPTKTAKANKTAKQAPKASTPSAPRFCNCGCGAQLNGKSLFRQGHDARMVSQLAVAVVGITNRSKAEPAVPTAFTKDEAKYATGSDDIQARIDATTGAVQAHYSAALASKFHSAAMNAWANYDKPARKAGKAAAKARTVEAKVGRWTKTGHLTAEGDLITTDAKGNEQVVAAGKFQLIK